MGSEEGRLIVTTHRPGRTRLLQLACCGLIVVTFFVGFMAGSHYFDRAMQEKKQQAKALVEAREVIALRDQQLTNLDVAIQVDRESLEHVRQELAALQGQVEKQEEELTLYRSLLKDTDGDGLHIDSLAIVAGDTPGLYHYRLVVRQKAALIKTINVEVDLRVEGTQAGQTRIMPLDRLDDSVAAHPLKAKFKYFKVLEGTLHISKDFEPQRVLVAVWQPGRRAKGGERQFNWPGNEEV